MTDRLLDYEGWATQQIHDLQREIERLRLNEEDYLRQLNEHFTEMERLREENDFIRGELDRAAAKHLTNLTTIASLRGAITKYLADPDWDADILTKALAATEAPQ